MGYKKQQLANVFKDKGGSQGPCVILNLKKIAMFE